jgi:hypothetical protein
MARSACYGVNRAFVESSRRLNHRIEPSRGVEDGGYMPATAQPGNKRRLGRSAFVAASS